MVFAVYDQGMRIHTPVEKLLKRRTVERVGATPATRRSADTPGEHADPERFKLIMAAAHAAGENEQPPQSQHASPTLQRAAQHAYQQAQQAGTPPQRGLAAHQVMTSPVVTLPADTPLAAAWEVFKEKGFHHIPILSHDQRLLGVITDRDLLRAAHHLGHSLNAESASTAPLTVLDLIQQQVITATPEAGITDIVQVMLEQRMDSMPIVDRQDSLVGIITHSDILRTLLNGAPLELWS